VHIKLPFAALRQFNRQPSKDRLRQFTSCPTVSARIAGTRSALQGDEQRGHADHGRHARALLVLEQDLREKRPQRDGWCVHGLCVIGEASVFIIERLLDRVFRQRVRKGKTGLLKKRGKNQTKSLWQEARLFV